MRLKSAVCFRGCRIETGVVHGEYHRQCAGPVVAARAGPGETAGSAVSVPSHLWRSRSRHQQLPPPHRRPVDGGFTVVDAFSRIVRLGEGLSQTGRCRRTRWTGPLARSRFARISFGAAMFPGSFGRDGGLPARREWRRIRRARPPRNRHRARHHRAAGRGPACRPRLPQAARAGRRAGADLRHRRRIDRACPGRPGGGHSEDPELVERALGRCFADRKRGKDALEGPDRLQAYGRMRERARRAFASFASTLPSDVDGIRLLGTSGTVTTLASVHLALARL